MKSVRLPSGGIYYAQEHNALRSDAAAAAFLHVHQQLGALALGTNPSNSQTLTLDINGSNVVLTFVTSIGSTAGNVLIGASAAATVANAIALLQNPTTTTSTGIALGTLSSPNVILVQYLGWGLPSGGTTITPFSLNTSTYSPLTSFSASTTVTSGTWTAQTMELYVQPGTYYVGSTRVLFLGGSTPTVTAPSSHPRIDLVTADSSGTIALVTGTENASPVAPSYPANKLVLAEVFNVVGETALYDNDNQQSGQGYVYNDVRPSLAPPYISSTSQIASGLFIPDPGSEATGDLLTWAGSAWARLPIGSNGAVLNVSGGVPTWLPTIISSKSGQSNYSGATGTQTIAHGLGKIPQIVRITSIAGGGTGAFTVITSIGVYDGTNNNCQYISFNLNSGDFNPGSATSLIIFIGTNGTPSPNNHSASCTVDATNIYLAWTKVGSGGNPSFMWEVIG
jgi:hypothetical protein